MPSRGHGVHGEGAVDYTPQQARRVLADLAVYEGAHRRTTVEQISERTGVAGRTVRQILSDADGVTVLLAGDDAGVYVAAYAEDADRLTRRLESQARRMNERAERRRGYADRELPRRQGALL